MVALAEVLQGLGYQITGSDVAEVFPTDVVLKKLSILYHEEFAANNIGEDVRGIVYSTAYGLDHIERRAAAERGLAEWSAPQIIGQLTERFSKTVAVAGSHGKTTTTSMLGLMLEDGGIDPTVMVGSPVAKWGSSARLGKSDWFVLEADEYQNKLALYHPCYAIVTNVDYDHPDFFKTKENYEQVFKDFISKISPDGLLVLCADDPFTPTLSEMTKARVITVGFSEAADWQIQNLLIGETQTRFSIKVGSETIFNIALPVVGLQYAIDATAAMVVAVEAGVSVERLRQTLATYHNTKRRLETWGSYHGAQVIDDYAHHPTEIWVTLDGLKKAHPNAKLWCIFESHTFSRTRAFLDNFAKALSLADHVLLYPVFSSAREHVASITNEDLASAVNAINANKAVAVNDLAGIKAALSEVSPNDLIITMGAGDVWKVAQVLTKEGSG